MPSDSTIEIRLIFIICEAAETFPICSCRIEQFLDLSYCEKCIILTSANIIRVFATSNGVVTAAAKAPENNEPVPVFCMRLNNSEMDLAAKFLTSSP